jgi:exopolyphosphatase / guanosine-5'-triphosphate,3'-diphosphate pyrophosphatase
MRVQAMKKPVRIAAIDIGTNSIRCIVVEAKQDGSYRILDDDKETVRLGEGLARNGAISGAAMVRAEAAIARIARLIKGLKVATVEVVATSAVRSATNGPLLVRKFSDLLGVPVQVISGEEEAALAAQSALRNFEMQGKRFGVLDVGGGSAELTMAQGNLIEEYYSLELGAVVMTERFLSADPPESRDLKKLQRHIKEKIGAALGDRQAQLPILVGSGGTITAIAQMVASQRRESMPSLHGMEIIRSEVVHLLAMLQRKTVAERKAVAGLSPERADIIVAGVALVDCVMEFFASNSLLVNVQGIREGVILQALRKHGLQPDGDRPSDWRSSVIAFGRSCQIEEEHAVQVAKLSLAIFDGLTSLHKPGKRERLLLEAAALLHDCGAFISYHSHHKHSYHLIRHAGLFGITPRERELVALMARYHRKSLPKKKHDEYQRLTEQEQQLVCRLGGILRLADGLDRRRSAALKVLGCSSEKGITRMVLKGDDDLLVEIHGGNAKKDLFEKAFDQQVLFTTA